MEATPNYVAILDKKPDQPQESHFDKRSKENHADSSSLWWRNVLMTNHDANIKIGNK